MPLEQGIELWQHPLQIAARGSVGRREQRVGDPRERRYDHDGPGAALRAVDHARHPLQCLGVRDGCAAELEDRRLTHKTHLWRLFRVGQPPRRAVRWTQTIVGQLFDERLSRRGTRPLSAGRLRPAAVRAGASDSEGQVHVATMLERESCPRAPGGVKRSEAARHGVNELYLCI